MRYLVHVISDLHLGGAPASEAGPAFQMCPPATHTLLAAYIDRLPPCTEQLESHLVIAGDVVDFLAEVPFLPFTGDSAIACAKLTRIFDSSKVVWDALARFSSQRKGILTLLLGNHDIELSLPRVRKMLLERLPGLHVRFIYDNEAFTLGPLLIEHGNRFDAWNAVPHDALRRVRSQMSRNGKVTPNFPALPGSRMVIDVINPLKQQYPFVDLLKPETAAALPIVAALGGIGLSQVWSAFSKYRAQKAVDYDEENAEPLANNYINASRNDDGALWLEAQQIGSSGKGQDVSALGDMLGRGVVQVSEKVRAARIDAVFAAFRSLTRLHRMHREAFDVEIEADTYIKPAQHAALRGFKVVVYGHTHLPKNVKLAPGTSGTAAQYLNTGTWADMMCIPEGIWDPDEESGRRMFRDFAGDLGANSLTKWRRAVPTYARIEIEGNTVVEAGLHFGDSDMPVTTEALMARLNAAVLA